MAITHVLGFTGDGGLSQSVSLSGGQELNIDETIAIAASDFLVAYVADISQIVSLYIEASQALTIKTNASGAPGVTLTLAANKPMVWHADIGTTIIQLLVVDITKLYVTNGSGTATVLKIRSVIDPTV